MLFAIWIVSILVCTAIGSKKGNPVSGFIVGLILGPIGIVLAIFSGDKTRISCKYCAEKISKKAVVCPCCQRDL
ncbi:hypothetical protein UB33_11015 [Photobacterium angustum]|uniref:hypothetical protein n=1 Tax=Photobacterium angustum TaxID=661 RepID=UPI0005E70292|nr:hypothetical protein [Photobacterium angustum]KJG05889.1 hypothetical protein UB33_11015 [Photobacterium angustum]PSV92619.1 hypothetical protein CTN01_12395 [Photobacterium angustum]